MIRHEVEIVNRLGLHARAAAKFVSCASGFECEVRIGAGHREVNGKSIMGVMLLAAGQGTRITLTYKGDDEEAAATAVEDLIANYFGEGG